MSHVSVRWRRRSKILAATKTWNKQSAIAESHTTRTRPRAHRTPRDRPSSATEPATETHLARCMRAADRVRDGVRRVLPASCSVHDFPMLVSRAVLFSPRERASSTRGATRCVSGFSHGVRAWQVGCQAGTTRARVSNVPNPTRGFTSLSRWVNPNAAAFQHAPVGTATKVVSFRKSQSIAGEPGRLFTHKRHQPLRGNRPSRQYTTKIRNYFGKDDVAIGKAVAYCKGGVPKLAVVTSAPFRRLLQVTDGDGTTDKVELKHVLNVFECVFPSVSVDSRTGVNCAFDLSTKAGKRSFEARFGGRLKKATELARHWVDEDEKGNGAALRQAWEKALSKQSDALPSPQYETTENSDGSLVRIPSGGNPPVAAEALAAGFPFFVEKTTGVDETEQERFAASYAAHVLLSSKNGVTFFSPHSKGRFSARSGKDVEIMSARSDEQDEENEQRREAWRVVRDAIDLPSSRKPAKETFVESCNLESRDGATADLQTESQTAAKLHITRSIQSMEAYALGSGRYTQGQLACAKQALQKVGNCTSKSAFLFSHTKLTLSWQNSKAGHACVGEERAGLFSFHRAVGRVRGLELEAVGDSGGVRTTGGFVRGRFSQWYGHCSS